MPVWKRIRPRQKSKCWRHVERMLAARSGLETSHGSHRRSIQSIPAGLLGSPKSLSFAIAPLFKP
jgi:hypothetical protein